MTVRTGRGFGRGTSVSMPAARPRQAVASGHPSQRGDAGVHTVAMDRQCHPSQIVSVSVPQQSAVSDASAAISASLWGGPELKWPEGSKSQQVYAFSVPSIGTLQVTQSSPGFDDQVTPLPYSQCFSIASQTPEGSTDIGFTIGLVVWDSAVQLANHLIVEASGLQIRG